MQHITQLLYHAADWCWIRSWSNCPRTTISGSCNSPWILQRQHPAAYPIPPPNQSAKLLITWKILAGWRNVGRLGCVCESECRIKTCENEDHQLSTVVMQRERRPCASQSRWVSRRFEVCSRSANFVRGSCIWALKSFLACDILLGSFRILCQIWPSPDMSQAARNYGLATRLGRICNKVQTLTSFGLNTVETCSHV